MAAATAGVVGGKASSASWMQFRGKERKHTRTNRSRVCCSYSSSVMDPYKTLRIQRGATESEVRKAFRQLALQYHPDVCRGSNCGVQFHEINEAYDESNFGIATSPCFPEKSSSWIKYVDACSSY